MVKEQQIKELTKQKIVTPINQELSQYGFKYLKSKEYFILKKNGFNHIIDIHTSHESLTYDENTEQIVLTFQITSRIELPEYEKWHLEKLGEPAHFSYKLDQVTSQVALSFEDFDDESFYEPTYSQQFKRQVALALIGDHKQHDAVMPFSDLLATHIHDIVFKLKAHANILHIHQNSEYPYQHTYLLLYGGYEAMAHEELHQYYQQLIDEIATQLKISDSAANDYIQALNKLIKETQLITTLSLKNPYKRAVKVIDSKNDYFEFSLKSKFREILRLDTSQFDVKAVHINPIGEILLFARNQKIIKLNLNGELLLEYDIATKKGFKDDFWGVPSGVIQGTNDFYVNNYIIKHDNTVLELPLPIQKLKRGKLQDPHIADFAFSHHTNQYLIIYEDHFITYNVAGQVEKTVNIEHKYGSKIIAEKQWIVTQQRDQANIILDFEGNTLATYEYAHVNNNFDFSPNYEHLICFFYSTKSQYYDLQNDKKETLWAHPTYIKGYKETMYNDTEHNFGMTIAKFSPDNSYIVGGAYHGKYVAWKLPDLERIELIPQEEMIALLEPLTSSGYANGEYTATITNAEKVTIANQMFLKNRRNNISNIFFIENGDVFVTELGNGKFVLSWDRNFSNLTYKKIDGHLDLHADKYLTQKTPTELTLYQQEA